MGLIRKSDVRRRLKEEGCNTSADLYPVLEKLVEDVVVDAAKTAKGAKRVTVKGVDVLSLDVARDEDGEQPGVGEATGDVTEPVAEDGDE